MADTSSISNIGWETLPSIGNGNIVLTIHRFKKHELFSYIVVRCGGRE